MATIRVIKRRIKSAKNIAQITKAMQMVAASKMKKAQVAAISARPYAEKIFTAVSELSKIVDTKYHLLLAQKNIVNKSLIILVTTNKGLCGSLNTNLFRKILAWYPDKEKYDFITLGIKGARFTARSGYKLVADFSKEAPFTKHTASVIDLVVESYLKGEYRQVIVVYNTFINALKIIPDSKQILPLTASELGQNTENILPSEFLIEPSPRELLNELIPHYLETLVRNAIIQQEASEHSARMLAMKSATDNANSLSDELTLIYNKLRQEQITYEIADITRAQLSLKH